MTSDQPPDYSGPRYCAHCGTGIAGEASYCPTCGTPLPVEISPPDLPAVEGQQYVQYMGFWIRLVALLVDSVLVAIAIILLVRLGGPIGTIGVYIASVLYYVLFTGLKGQTIGKMVMGIQVVNSQGMVPGIGKAALREVIGKFVSSLPLNLGYAWAGWDRRKRAWHDHISGTFVVRKRR